MSRALNTLLEGVIDYAGLFPPAALGMEEATAEYLMHLNGPESWLVNRFICPASRLNEFSDQLEIQQAEIEFEVSVLGTGGSDVSQFARSVTEDIAGFMTFSSKCSDICEIQAFEVKAPKGDIKAAAKALSPLSEIEVFLEIPWGESMLDDLHAIAETEWLGAKARTGGLDAASFPSSEQLALFIQECLNLNVACKLTAGLHHPIRQRDPITGGMMHGFLNVLAAAALADEHSLGRREIVAILETVAPRAFSFDQDGLEWNGLRTNLDGIEDMRGIVVGFGSCSVKEPMEDLVRLGLLDGVRS